MPALIDYRSCDDSPYCSAARMCPSRAFQMKGGKWIIDAAACGGCPGMCTRMCPSGAIHYAPTLAALEAKRSEIESSSETADDLFEKRYGVRPGDPRAEGKNLAHVGCNDFKKEVLDSNLPAVVDFWAEWCAPCKVIAPTFKKLAEEYEGKMRFFKMDTEECNSVPGQYGIRSIPTMLFFMGGEVVAYEIGAIPEGRFRQTIERVLKVN